MSPKSLTFIAEFLESRLLMNGHSIHAKHPRHPAKAAAAIQVNWRVAPVYSVLAATSKSSPSSVPASWRATPNIQLMPRNLSFNADGTTGPQGRTPAQIRGAYGLGQYGASNIKFGSVQQGDGKGETIAIIDAYNDPNALSDLNGFSAQFGLPLFNGVGLPTFQVLNQNGATSPLPGTDPVGPDSPNGTWEEEESLDIEWAHAMAPNANIILVEAIDSTNNLYTAVAAARTIPGVVAVSMSWSGNEFRTETTSDTTYFTTPSPHLDGAGLAGGITFLASSGDSGIYAGGTTTITPQYPTASPNVVSVGGTSLTVNGNAYGGEVAWGNGTASGTQGGGGGGVSARETQPSYQNGVVNSFSTTHRTYPDISLEADPGTPTVPLGVALYDSWDFGSATPWFNGYYGGTSLSSPMMAGLIAVADQGRDLAGLGSLNGLTQTLPKLYQLAASSPLYSTDFHDILTGNNGDAAGTGYDLATGIGSPIANTLIASLVGIPVITAFTASPNPVAPGSPLNLSATVTDPNVGATITQVAFYRENNGTAGLQTTGGTPDAFVGNGAFSSGAWSFSAATTGLASGNYTYYAVATDSLSTVSMVASTTATIQSGSLTLIGNNIYLKSDADGVSLDEWIDAATPGTGTPTHKVALSSITGVIFNGSTGPDSLTLDFSAGHFANGFTNGITENGSGSGANALTVVGTSANDTLTASGPNLTFASTLGGFNPVTITLNSVQSLSLPGGSGGSDLIDVASGTYTVNADTPTGTPNVSVTVQAAAVATFTTDQHLAGLTITDGTAAVVSATRRTIDAAALSIQGHGKLDLGGNDLLTLTPVATVVGYLTNGYAAGNWNGATANGNIVSSSAAGSGGTRTLAYASAGDNVVPVIPAGKTLVQYTIPGDANLDGTVDFKDFTSLQVGFGKPGNWSQGDFNYTGTVDFNDFTIMQNNFGA